MIQIFHLSKTYASSRRALSDINLEISKGELVFIIGASGAGKTTLLKLLFREEEPSEGQILVEGKNIARLNRRGVARLRRSIGLVFQECKLLAGLTALQNVSLAAEVVGVSRRESRIKAYQLLRELGLKDRHDAKPLTLSAGEQQRVGIARALINDQILLLADEPTGNLDAEAADETMRVLLRMRERGATVMIATHDLAIVDRCEARVISLERGVLADDAAWGLAGGHFR